MIVVKCAIEDFIKKIGLGRSEKESDDNFTTYVLNDFEKMTVNKSQYSDNLFEVVKLAITSPALRFTILPKELLVREEINSSNFDNFIVSITMMEMGMESKKIEDKKLELIKLYNLK